MQYSDAYFTNRDGLKLHYRDYHIAPTGAPTVLCMPGLTRNAKDFGYLANHLAHRCRMICAEQRGRGLSDYDPDPGRYSPATYVDDMFELLDHLGLTSVYVVGTSLGGLMTMMMQAMRPGIFKAAIINDIGPEVDPAGIARITSYVGKGTPPETWDQAVSATKAANANVYPHFKDADWREFTELLYAEKDGKPVAAYDPAIRNNFTQKTDQAAPDLWPVFAAMHSIPLLVLRGETSDILSADTLVRMQSEHPNCTAVTVPRIGHVPQMREPEVLAAIDRIIQ